jgi:RNA polymerase sigma factor (sigma-70 family)
MDSGVKTAKQNLSGTGGLKIPPLFSNKPPPATWKKKDMTPLSPDPLLAALNDFQTGLLKYAFSLCRDEELAQDAVQDTFLRLAKEYRRLDPHELGRWLFTVCRNRCIDLTRAGRRIVALNPATYAEAPDEKPRPDAAVQLRDETELMLSAVDELPEALREVVRLRYFGGLAYDEIARTTRQSTGTVGWLLHEALKNLRHKLCPSTV